MAEPEIDLLLVTGAGASREFGVEGKPFPLMADWSEALFEKLRAKGSLLDFVALKRGMAGEDFEETLGAFLRRRIAFTDIEPFLSPSSTFWPRHPPGSESNLNEWHRAVESELQEADQIIYECLYEEFGAGHGLDVSGATAAYGALFETMGLNQESRIVVATTNYDLVGETALAELGMNPNWGEKSHPVYSDVAVDVTRLVDGIGGYTPLLHLHGRVGWYRRRETGKVESARHTKFEKGLGTPIVMLPDPNKDYSGDDVINALWMQFETALDRSKSVFVLGHSLNDTRLRTALSSHVKPAAKLAVSVLPNPSDPRRPLPEQEDWAEWVGRELGGRVLPVQFGPIPTIDDKIRGWHQSA